MSGLQINSQPVSESIIDYQFPIEIVRRWHAFPVVTYMNAALTPRVQEYALAELGLFHSFDAAIWATIFDFLKEQPKTIFCFVVAQRILPHGIELNRLLNQYIIIKPDDCLVTQGNNKQDFVDRVNDLPLNCRLPIRFLESKVAFTLKELKKIALKTRGLIDNMKVHLYEKDRPLLEELIAKQPEIFLQIEKMKLVNTFMPISLLQNLLKLSHRLEELDMILGTKRGGDLASLEGASLPYLEAGSLPYLRRINVRVTHMTVSDIVCLLQAANRVEDFEFEFRREFPRDPQEHRELDFIALGVNSLLFLKRVKLRSDKENVRAAFYAAFQRAAPHLTENS